MRRASKGYAVVIAIGVTVLMVDSLSAQFRQHGSHEHGATHLNLAVFEHTLAIEFITPAVNIPGFERKARTQAETAGGAADLANAGAFVIGDEIPGWRDLDLAGIPVSL